MSEDSLNLVLQKITKQNLIRHGKIQIKLEKLTLWRNIFQSWSNLPTLSSVIDSTLGHIKIAARSVISTVKIVRSLMSIYFCGGAHALRMSLLVDEPSLAHPTICTCSSDTILRAIKECQRKETSHTHQIRVRTTISTRLTHSIPYCSIVVCVCIRPTEEGEMYDVDFDHQFAD